MAGVYPVGTVARLTGLTARRIRYYERLGLVSPARDGNRRLYTDAEVARLTEVRDRLEAGQSLRAVCQALAAEPDGGGEARAAGPQTEMDLWGGDDGEENDVEAALLGRLGEPAIAPLSDLTLVRHLMARHARQRPRADDEVPKPPPDPHPARE